MFSTLRQFMRLPAGLQVDFTHPPQAPALTPAEGVSWRIFANPVALLIGGASAVLLELAQPSVRTGVWEHSSFRHDPAGRLHRTGYAAMVTVYAPEDQARAMIARVVNEHRKVQGQTPSGVRYTANDPLWLTWVQATAVFGFSEAYHRHVAALSPGEKDCAFAEGQASARLYGAAAAPPTWQAWEQLLQATVPGLESSEILAQFLDIMDQSALLPRIARPLQRLLARIAGWVPLRGLPPAQAAQRMQVRRR